MEDILEVYQQPYNSRFPVLCFDEKPYQLLQGVAQELPMKPGGAAKVDSQYGGGEPVASWRLWNLGPVIDG